MEPHLINKPKKSRWLPMSEVVCSANKSHPCKPFSLLFFFPSPTLLLAQESQISLTSLLSPPPHKNSDKNLQKKPPLILTYVFHFSDYPALPFGLVYLLSSLCLNENNFDSVVIFNYKLNNKSILLFVVIFNFK